MAPNLKQIEGENDSFKHSFKTIPYFSMKFCMHQVHSFSYKTSFFLRKKFKFFFLKTAVSMATEF